MPAQAATTPANETVLLREQMGGVAVLTLNRPQARNSLSESLLEELTREFAAIARDKSIRAVVIAASGNVF